MFLNKLAVMFFNKPPNSIGKSVYAAVATVPMRSTDDYIEFWRAPYGVIKVSNDVELVLRYGITESLKEAG